MLLYTHLFPLCNFFLTKFLAAFSFNDKHTLTLWLICLIICKCFLNCCCKCSLVLFGQFPAHRNSSVSKSLQQFPQCTNKSVRRLIQNHCPCLIYKFVQYRLLFFFICRQKCLKRKSSCRKSRQRQCRNTCCCSRQRCDFNPFLIAHLHKLFPRI